MPARWERLVSSESSSGTKSLRKAEPDAAYGFLSFTHPINTIGYTAASVPCGFSPDGMPIGLQIIGREGDEETVIAASAAFERAQPWADRRPQGA